MDHYYEVAVPRPIRKQFTYQYRATDNGDLVPGTLVKAPFGRASVRGIVTRKVSHPQNLENFTVKALTSVESYQPALSQTLLNLCQWISDTYFCSLGEALFNALPAFRKKPEISTPALESSLTCCFTKTLTKDQSEAIQFIFDRWQEKKPFFIHGVTGSGKTEIYLRCAERVLREGKTVIYLVPEISIVGQIQRYVEAVYPGQVAVFHSRQTDKEKMDTWKKVISGQCRIVLGPRSALFAPLEKVGLIIVDEEHDNSYKQDETPRFHAREVAKKRAELEGAHLIMGTATPSLESFQDARSGNMHLIRLPRRIAGGGMPEIHLVDFRSKRNRANAYFSETLVEKIDDRLKKKEGVLIFLNRRGFATQVICSSCGYFTTCGHCDVGMTYHQQKNYFICHYCGRSQKPSQKCPECKEPLVYKGVGTERIESELARKFPKARIGRLDRDTASKRGYLENLLNDFRNQEVDILVGTQMLSKGLDFPHLTLVGILSADHQLQLSDFRASERTYQLLEQVVGRSGRGEVVGEVIIQTYIPDHYSIRSVARKNEDLYFERELEHRRKWNYPPFSEIINFTLRGKQEGAVIEEAEKLKEVMVSWSEGEKIEVLGPAPLPFYRLRGYYRWHIMIRGTSLEIFRKRLSEQLNRSRLSAKVYVEIDVNPTQIL